VGRPKGSGNKQSKKIETICPACGKHFWRCPSVLKKLEEAGHIAHCSRACARVNRKNTQKQFGSETANWRGGQGSYRQRAIRECGLICEQCGYDGTTYPGLIWVHHKDGNRNHNELNNLEVLCIRCHLEKHYAI